MQQSENVKVFCIGGLIFSIMEYLPHLDAETMVAFSLFVGKAATSGLIGAAINKMFGKKKGQ